MEYVRFATKQTSALLSDMSRYPPPQTSPEYSQKLADLATRILYCSPLPSHKGLPLFVLNAAAFPDANEVDYNKLLPYILARLPADEELIGGHGYEIIFFAGGDSGITGSKKTRPGWGWFFQAYHLLTRAARKRLVTFIIVHESSFVRVLVEMFSTIISPKFRKKIVHAATLSVLAQYLPIEDVLIPPSAYTHDRKVSPDIQAPFTTGRRAFGVQRAFSFVISQSGEYRLPRVLRETSMFLMLQESIQKEGLFRISASNQTVHILAEAYDRGQKFIVWKDDNVYLPFQDTLGRRFDPLFVEEADLDGYGVHVAAALIKLWYRELFRPLIPLDSYGEIQRLWPSDESGREPTMKELTDLISISSLNTTLPLNSRLILTAHLIPLLSIIAQFSDKNRMPAGNLAVCFAPTLTRGEDPMQEVRIANTVTKLLTTCINLWDEGLREACGQSSGQFRKLLSPPLNGDFYEDPLDQPRADTEPHLPQTAQQGEIWESYSPVMRPVPQFQSSQTVARKPVASEDPFTPPRPSPTVKSNAIKRKSVSIDETKQPTVAELPVPVVAPVVEEPATVPAPGQETTELIAVEVQEAPPAIIEPVETAPEVISSTVDDTTRDVTTAVTSPSSLAPIRRKHVPAKSFGGAAELRSAAQRHNAAKSFDGTVDEREFQQPAASFERFDLQLPALAEISHPVESQVALATATSEPLDLTPAVVDDNSESASETILTPPESTHESALPATLPVDPYLEPPSADITAPALIPELPQAVPAPAEILSVGPAETEPVIPGDISQAEKLMSPPQVLHQSQPNDYFAGVGQPLESVQQSSLRERSGLPDDALVSTPVEEPLKIKTSPSLPTSGSPLFGSHPFQRTSSGMSYPERPSSVASDSSWRSDYLNNNGSTGTFGAPSPGTPGSASGSRSQAPHAHLLRKVVPNGGQSALSQNKSDANDVLFLSRTIKPQPPSLKPVIPTDATKVDILDSPVLIRRGTTKLTSSPKAKEEPPRRKINLAGRDLGDLKRIYEDRAISAQMLADASRMRRAE